MKEFIHYKGEIREVDVGKPDSETIKRRTWFEENSSKLTRRFRSAGGNGKLVLEGSVRDGCAVETSDIDCRSIIPKGTDIKLEIEAGHQLIEGLKMDQGFSQPFQLHILTPETEQQHRFPLPGRVEINIGGKTFLL